MYLAAMVLTLQTEEEAEYFAKDMNILESFVYARQKPKLFDVIHKNCKRILLDSGAYTFMASKKDLNINWDEYIEEYAAFIKEKSIEDFFELDIDSIVGYEEVKRLRKKLEKLTGKKPIIVWHKSRGIEEFVKMCKENDRASIGGIVNGEITRKERPIINRLVKIAHDNGCKIHGLGCVREASKDLYNLDSSDSSSWNICVRSGRVPKYNGTFMEYFDPPNGKKFKRAEMLKHAIKEWRKFCKDKEEQ